MRALTATLLLTAVLGCSATGRTPTAGATPRGGMGCEGPAYPAPATSQYILPYAPGLRFPTGLTNCSSSFHGAGEGDQYAYDFNMPVGTPFIAMRAGKVAKVVNDQPDEGEDGGAGNFLVIDHEDGTFGLYYHSPKGGIAVAVGAEVEQGAPLGVTGRSGYAGYPHLHVIVVEGHHEWPYLGVPISFRNANPRDLHLRSEYAPGYLADPR